MKVIFLDFDGVINNYSSMISMELINNKCIDVLKRIIHETNAKVVVTSSNKYKYQNNNTIEEFQNSEYVKGLKLKNIGIHDCTPLVNQNREQEIKEYLTTHPEIEQYVILDDDYILESFKEHEIFLDLQAGLKEKHIIPAIRILNGKLDFYHDCTKEQLSETIEERVIRMNQVISEMDKNNEFQK